MVVLQLWNRTGDGCARSIRLALSDHSLQSCNTASSSVSGDYYQVMFEAEEDTNEAESVVIDVKGNRIFLSNLVSTPPVDRRSVA
jgi:hypothetical protein